MLPNRSIKYILVLNGFTYSQVIYAVNKCFIGEVWNNLDANVIVCRLLKCVITYVKGIHLAKCLSFDSLEIKVKNKHNIVASKDSKDSDV